jgi:hypothetical protein
MELLALFFIDVFPSAYIMPSPGRCGPPPWRLWVVMPLGYAMGDGDGDGDIVGEAGGTEDEAGGGAAEDLLEPHGCGPGFPWWWRWWGALRVCAT